MVAQLTRFPHLKASKVDWLDDIPSHWEVRRFKYLLQETDARSVDGTEQLLSVSQYTGVSKRDPNDGVEHHDTRADTLVGYKKVCPADLVVNIMLAWNGSMGVSRFSGIVSPAYCVYRWRAGVHPWYFHYLLRSTGYKTRIRVSSRGVVDSRLRLYTDDLYRIESLVPPLSEQRRIVRFLDHADRCIRRFIRAKQRLIALLEEQKQVIIHQAVTGKIDVRTGHPYSAYKSSGVDWLDKIPEHWSVVRLKFVAEKIVDCLHETPTYSETGEFPAIRTADISPGTVRLGSARRIEEREYLRWTERLEPLPNDILYSREGERFGIAACVPEGIRLCISQRMMVFRIRSEHNPVFVMWALNSRQVYAQACQDLMGSTAPHINVSTIRNYAFSIPSRNQQDAVVESIGSTIEGLSGAIAKARDSVARAREYQLRIVSDVVTGRLNVREAAGRCGAAARDQEPRRQSRA